MLWSSLSQICNELMFDVLRQKSVGAGNQPGATSVLPLSPELEAYKGWQLSGGSSQVVRA